MFNIVLHVAQVCPLGKSFVWILCLCCILSCNFTKSNTPEWVFFTFCKLYKWYQILQSITNYFFIITSCLGYPQCQYKENVLMLICLRTILICLRKCHEDRDMATFTCQQCKHQVNNGKTRTICEIYSKIAIKTREWRHIVLRSFLLTLKKSHALFDLLIPLLTLNK